MMRRKRVQVGWFCDHDHEPFDSRSHVKEEWKRGKLIPESPAPSTVKQLQFLDYQDPKKVPPCPLSEPVYVYREVDQK